MFTFVHCFRLWNNASRCDAKISLAAAVNTQILITFNAIWARFTGAECAEFDLVNCLLKADAHAVKTSGFDYEFI